MHACMHALHTQTMQLITNTEPIHCQPTVPLTIDQITRTALYCDEKQKNETKKKVCQAMKELVSKHRQYNRITQVLDS